MNKNDLYSQEEQVIREAEELLASGALRQDPEGHFRRLLAGYRKLFGQVKRVVKISDKIDLELKRSREELKRQNEILQENVRLREDVERITRHDLKSPLTAIVGFPQVVIEELGESLRPDLRAALLAIEESGYTMLSMINLSLDLYKMETGAYVLKPAPVNLVQVIRKIRKELEPLVGRKKIDARLSVEGRPAVGDSEFMVLGEELLCYSLLSNLLRNAVEASPRGEAVTVSLAAGPADPSPLARVSIRNNGAVPETMRERFFEKYATAGKEGGTGLGTYSAKLIAETQGGGIALDASEPGATTVTVSLPMPAACGVSIPRGEGLLGG